MTVSQWCVLETVGFGVLRGVKSIELCPRSVLSQRVRSCLIPYWVLAIVAPILCIPICGRGFRCNYMPTTLKSCRLSSSRVLVINTDIIYSSYLAPVGCYITNLTPMPCYDDVLHARHARLKCRRTLELRNEYHFDRWQHCGGSHNTVIVSHAVPLRLSELIDGWTLRSHARSTVQPSFVVFRHYSRNNNSEHQKSKSIANLLTQSIVVYSTILYYWLATNSTVCGDDF